MTHFDTAQALALLIVVCIVPLAIASTWQLWRLYRRDHRRSLLLLAFLVVAVIATVIGPWIAVQQIVRLLGYPPLEWARPITSLLLIAVLMIPYILAFLVRRVGRDPNQPDNIGSGPA